MRLAKPLTPNSSEPWDYRFYAEKGDVWDKQTAQRFRSMLLATGKESDRTEAYRAFWDRDPDVKYIMKKRGFPTND
jgi:peptidyl-dipeptidase Dcp